MYCAFGLVAVVGSFGKFEVRFDASFYTKFTNLSNYLCLAIMVAELVQTARKRNDSPVDFSPLLKFVGMLSILLTFFVFNIMLMPTRTVKQNLSVGSLLCHQVLPVLYVADWVVSYRRGQVGGYLSVDRHAGAHCLYDFHLRARRCARLRG